MIALNITMGVALGMFFLVASCAEQNSLVQKPMVKKSPSRAVVTPVTKPKMKTKPGTITGVDMGRLFTMIQTGKVHLIDCRPPIFYRMGHIGGAVNLPLKKYASVLPSQRPLLDAAVKSNKVTVLYCQNTECPDGYAVAKKLVQLGYSVSIYKGGWEEWHQAGLE